MFVKQIAQNEALSLAAKGVEIMIMVPDSENNVWGGMTPDTLQNLLSGLMFFRREPALENPIIKEDEGEISTPPTSQQSLLEVLQTLPLAPINQPPTVWLPVRNGKRE